MVQSAILFTIWPSAILTSKDDNIFNELTCDGSVLGSYWSKDQMSEMPLPPLGLVCCQKKLLHHVVIPPKWDESLLSFGMVKFSYSLNRNLRKTDFN